MSMKIVWLDLNSSYAHASLALPAIHAQLKEGSDFAWVKISATINEDPGLIAGKISAEHPDILAATCWLFTHEMLLHILARSKALLPECLVVLGGPEFLGDNAAFLHKNRFVDGVFRGEGEEVFGYWLEVCKDKSKWNAIEGLCYLSYDGVYTDNGIAKVKDFTNLIAPEESAFFNWEKPFVQLETTRGCFNTCAFCVSGGEKPVRSLDMTEIRRRVDIIYQHGIRNVRVLDRTFNYNRQHAKALLNLFRDYPEICFHLEIHPALLPDELRQIIADMPVGTLHLEAGIQSLHEEVLQICRRNGKLEDALDGLRFLCGLNNLETHADLIAGLPLYKLEQIFDDVVVLAEYGAGEIQLESLKLLPGTEMRRRARELGICYSPLPPYEVLQTRDITPNELQTAKHLSRLLDGYYNASAWHDVTRELILSEKDFLHVFLKHLEDIGVIDQPLSLERRGIILYEFCKQRYPARSRSISVAWIENGLSLKKQPAEYVKTKRQLPPKYWQVLYGEYKNTLRLCFLPEEENGTAGFWFGYESEVQQMKPAFKAISQ